MFIGDEANPFKAHREDFREAPKAPSNVIPFPSDRARLTEMEAEAVRFAAAFSKLPPEEQRRVWFAGRLAGRSATEAFNRPRAPHAVGADSYYRERGEAEAPKKEKRKGPKLEPAPDAPEPKAENFVDELARPPMLFIYRNPGGSPHSFVARWGDGEGEEAVAVLLGRGQGPRAAMG